MDYWWGKVLMYWTIEKLEEMWTLEDEIKDRSGPIDDECEPIECECEAADVDAYDGGKLTVMLMHIN